MNKLAILGASGHGKVVAEVASKIGWEMIEFYDAVWPSIKALAKWPVVGDEKSFFNEISKYDGVFIAIGNNSIRREKIEQVAFQQGELVNLIAPSAVVSDSVSIRKGILISEGAVVNIDVRIEDGVIINTGATVDHDCHISRFAHICPGVNLAGNVNVGSESFVGIGSSVIQGINIAKKATIGAGSVIIRDVPENHTVAGVPAKAINKD